MDIQTLERAADAVLAGPNEVSEADRRMAENIYQRLKEESYPLDSYIQALRQTNHQFVLYEMSQALAQTLLRRWVMIESEDIQAAFKAILEYVVTNESLSTYVISDLLRTAAIMLKRGICDKKTGRPQEICDMIKTLITNENTRVQSIACQFISAIIEQFSSAWRSAHLSITWDFHVTAKGEFERTMLRSFFEMSLETLSLLCAQPDLMTNEFYKNLCSRFLEVADTIVQWNFSARIFRRFLAHNTLSNSFRPPNSWYDLVSKEDFLDLFFQLHSLIRSDEELSLKSLSCLSQLASFSGEIMASHSEFAQDYISQYIRNLIQIFREGGPLPHEISGLCLIINRLFVFRPIGHIVRLDNNRRAEFFAFFYEFMKYLIKGAMSKAIAHSDHTDQSSLALLLDAWVIMLRGRWHAGLDQETQQSIEEELLRSPTQDLVSALILSVQSPPFGTRPPVSQDEEQADDDDDTDDRELFKDVFNPFSTMTAYTVDSFVPSASHLIHTKVEELKSLINGNFELARLQTWQEDMHWLMLFVANSVVTEDLDGSCSLAAEIFEATVDAVQQRRGGKEYSEDTKIAYLIQCIQDPTADRPLVSDELDPFTILLGEIIAWNSLENQMVLSDNSRQAVSPELTRSSVLCLRRFVHACSHSREDYSPQESLQLSPNDVLSEALVHFIMQKVFSILQYFSGEKKLCEEAVDLLASLIDSRAQYLSRGDRLYDFLCKVDLIKLRISSKLMKTLVLIAAQVDDVQIQERMYQQMLVPLINRFNELCAQPSSSEVDSGIVDLLQCLNGVSWAARSNTAVALTAVYLEFLSPLLSNCVPLMYSRANSQSIISAILLFMRDVTTKVVIYIEDPKNASVHYEALIEIVKAYAQQQKSRFVTVNNNDEEDKAQDLVYFIDILSNVLSRDILEISPENGTSGAQVVMMALEMLLSIMNEDILKIPEVAAKFYRLLVYLVEFSSDALDKMSEQLMQSVFQCIKIGMSSAFGGEIVSLACEALTEISLFMCRSYAERPNIQVVAANIHELLPLVFETCLDYSSENSLFAEASSALFGVICFDREYFENFVRNMLSQKSNEEAAVHLREAFDQLLPEELRPTRQARLEFRRRMEKLLTGIQGLLSLS